MYRFLERRPFCDAKAIVCLGGKDFSLGGPVVNPGREWRAGGEIWLLGERLLGMACSLVGQVGISRQPQAMLWASA